MKVSTITALLLQFLLLLPLSAQGGAQDPQASFENAAQGIQQQLEASTIQLSALRERVSAERVPLSRQLRDLEAELLAVRKEYQEATREYDRRTLSLSDLTTEIEKQKSESSYLRGLFNDYINGFESRLHISEKQRYGALIQAARLAPENKSLSPGEIFAAQTKLVLGSLERLEGALGGDSFAGQAVDAGGLIKQGTFLLVGPSALFRSNDGLEVGTAETRLGSQEPAVIRFADPRDQEAAVQLITNSSGRVPFDPTQGNAHKIESTEQTLIEHIMLGGPVMVPILALAAAALLVALYKWITLLMVRKPTKQKLEELLQAVGRRDKPAVIRLAQALGSDTGQMLEAGARHLGEGREMVEELMFEKVLANRQRYQSFLPFVAISASSAPLLGLLGTVTGIMNTFQLITVFGTGDVKTLSSGISEALITTEYGLIVAIPSLLMHSFLSRKARGMVDQLDKTALAFLNRASDAQALPVEQVA